MSLARTHLPFFIALFGCILSTHAKESSGRAGSAADLLANLFQSWQWATFGVSIVAEFFALVLVCISFQSLGRYITSKQDGSPKTDNWNVGGAFCGFAILGSCFLAAFYPLFLVQQLAPALFNVASVTHSIIPSGMMILTSDMADVTIACAFLAFLRRRQWLHVPESISRWKTIFDIVVIVLMITFTSVKTALACIFSTYESESKYNAMVDLFHVYTSFYLLITISIITSAFVLRRALVEAAIEDEVVLTNLCFRICPLLGAQGIFRLVYEIIISLPIREAQHINYDALTLVEIVVKFLAYTFALLYGLRVFYPGKALISVRHSG